MKKFENIGRKLNRAEMKSIAGGKILMSQSGYNLNGSNCTCDFSYIYPNGSVLTYCYIPCAMTCCDGSNSCSYLIGPE